jgi:hypothetical protein
VREDYSLKWLAAQNEQCDLRFKIEEKRLNDSMTATKKAIDKEKRISKLIERHYSMKIEEIRTESERMSAVYDKMLEETEWKLQIARNDKKHFFEMVKREEELFAQRQTTIDTYLEAKRRAAAEKKQRELEQHSSTKIQAWWRFVMVRRFLGPFKSYKKRAREIRRERREKKKKSKK